MPISLQKGQKVNITKDNPGLTKLMIGLGWDTNRYDGGKDFDLDATVFLTGDDQKTPSQDDFIFFGNLKHTSGCVAHQGDNLTGAGEGDDEQILVELDKVPENISHIFFAVTIYEAEERRQNFGQVSNAFIRLVDQGKNEELIRYDLGEDFSIETAVVVGEIYKNGSEWKFNAVGSGFQGGLAALCGNYGINIG